MANTLNIKQETRYLEWGQFCQIVILQQRVLRSPHRSGVIIIHFPQIQIKLFVVKNLNRKISRKCLLLLYLPCPELVLNLTSLSPGLLAPVSVARVDFMGLTPGTSRARDTGRCDVWDLNSFTLSVWWWANSWPVITPWYWVTTSRYLISDIRHNIRLNISLLYLRLNRSLTECDFQRCFFLYAVS